MKKILIALSIVILTVAATEVNAQKIGYISTNELISIMPDTEKANTTLTEFRNALIQNATEKQNAFYAAIEKFQKDSLTMTEAQKSVKRQDLTKMSQDLSQEEERMQNQLQAKSNELLAPIQKKAMDAIQAVAKEAGYTYVIEKEVVLVGPPGDDILNLVAKKLNISTTPPAANR